VSEPTNVFESFGRSNSSGQRQEDLKVENGMRNIEAGTLKGPAVAAHSDQSRRAAPWRTIGYGVAIGYFFLAALAWIRPDLNRTEIPDWRPLVTLADAAREKGDLRAARHLYLQVDWIASSQQDWEGLVAAACGIKTLDGAEGPYSKTFALLIRAVMAAENRQSRAGIATVAKVFAASGQDKAASMVSSRIRPDWPEELLDSSRVAALGCWKSDTGAT
jgi:hypothetical protein